MVKHKEKGRKAGSSGHSGKVPQKRNLFTSQSQVPDFSYREALEPQGGSSSTSCQVPTGRPKPRNLESLLNMTPKEQEEHFNHCINLCNKNKVNMKNAFKLCLIDYMRILLEKRENTAKSLMLMSCTLESSTKIYAYRVDKVYIDTLKLVKGKTGKALSDEEDNVEGETDDNTPLQKTLRTNVSSDDEEMSDEEHEDSLKKIIGSAEIQTRNKPDRAFYGTYMPRNQEYFLQSMTGPEGVLDLNPPLIDDFDDLMSTNDRFISLLGGKQSIENDGCSKLSLRLHGYTQLFKKYHIISDNETIFNTVRNDCDVLRSNEAVVEDELLLSPLPESSHQDEPDYDEDFVENPADLRPFSETDGRSAANDTFTVNHMCSLVSSDTASDYSFFDNTKFDFWNPPAHWKIKKRGPQKHDGTVGRKKKRKADNIPFSRYADLVSIASEFVGEVNKNLARRTIHSWRNSKCFVLNKMKNIPRACFGLFFLEGPLLTKLDPNASKNNLTSLIDESGVDEEIPAAFDDDQMSDSVDCDAGLVEDPLGTAQPVTEQEEEEMPTTQELVPAPPMVAKIPLCISKAPKKCDIRLVKCIIWDVIQEESSKNANSGVPFPIIYSELKTKLPKDLSDDLSISVAFLSLLSVVNDRTLRLKGENNHILACLDW